MSMLVGLAVVVLAIAGVVQIALRDPEQPPTMRRPSRSGNPVPAAGVAMSAQPAAVRSITVPERAMFRARDAPPTSRGRSIWTRVRSGIALVVLLAVVGVMLALAVAAVLVGGGLAIRSAVS